MRREDKNRQVLITWTSELHFSFCCLRLLREVSYSKVKISFLYHNQFFLTEFFGVGPIPEHDQGTIQYSGVNFLYAKYTQPIELFL